METNYIIDQLQNNLSIFHSLLTVVTEKEIVWHPSQGKWCLLQIVCHLYDEEREDFRPRIKHTLYISNQPLIPIDPAGWVISRRYHEQNFHQKLRDFAKEREQSILWLKNLQQPNWYNAVHHKTLGDLSAYKFLASWLAHDYLHIRQITRLKYDYLQHLSGQDLSYAGSW